MHALASIPNIVYAFLLRLFGPSITPLATEFGLGSKLELRGTMKAALYPAWRVDSIVEGRVTVGSARGISKRLEPKVWISTTDAYVPGKDPIRFSQMAIAHACMVHRKSFRTPILSVFCCSPSSRRPSLVQSIKASATT